MRSERVSRREAEVLALLGARLSNAQIAGRLHLSVRTVVNHVSALPRTRPVTERLGAHRFLLILDNCEHLLDPVAAFTDRVLSACSGTTILATSRERLGLPGERVVPIAPLPLASDAEALFVDRATAADPGF